MDHAGQRHDHTEVGLGLLGGLVDPRDLHRLRCLDAFGGHTRQVVDQQVGVIHQTSIRLCNGYRHRPISDHRDLDP
jgi:hypothetical protein